MSCEDCQKKPSKGLIVPFENTTIEIKGCDRHLKALQDWIIVALDQLSGDPSPLFAAFNHPFKCCEAIADAIESRALWPRKTDRGFRLRLTKLNRTIKYCPFCGEELPYQTTESTK